MEFASADPSVVKSIRQRYLLNEWLRAAGKRRPMPLLRDFQLDRVDDETADMMGYDVVGEGDGARFLITHQGARLATTYGNERKALALMLAQPSMIKRPVLDLGAKLLVGFKPDVYGKEVPSKSR